jgi:hypothetical protein
MKADHETYPFDLKSGRMWSMYARLKAEKNLWELYTKKEEYNPPFLDIHQRCSYYFSRNSNIFSPTISEFLLKHGLTVHYPQGKQFAVCLTHDIDKVFSHWKARMSTSLKYAVKHKFGTSFHTLFEVPPFLKLDEIMDLEKKYGAISSFYFLVADKDISPDERYNPDDIQEEIRNIVQRGWEVGLHGGYYAYNDIDTLTKEKERLERVIGKKVIGYRNHFLRFKTPDTWDLLQKAGFSYDSTYGYADCVGFRNALCHPFKPFNLNTTQFIDLLEIPLIIMDSTLFQYMKLDVHHAWTITKQLIDTVEKHRGVITVLWHNTSMIGEKLDFYKKILAYCQEKNAWFASGEQIRKWWKENDFFG